MNGNICERRASEIMNPAPPVVSSKTSVQDALRLVRVNGYSALPVCDGGRFPGVPTRSGE